MGASLVLVALLAAFAGAGVVPLAYRRWPRAAAWGAVALAGALAAIFAAWVPDVARGRVVATSLPWVPELGVAAAIRLDGLALAFALLITGIGALVLAYAIGYLGHGPRLGRMLGLLLLFLGSMLGLVVADDTIAIFVFWELTSVSSFFLIAFDDTSAETRARARLAFVITALGGLALLVGFLLLGAAARDLGAAGGLAVAPSALAGVDVRAHALYPVILVLIAAGAFTKSAHVPFHTWLPGAMVAPTPVSAYLHSATMVKAGVFVLARFHASLGGTPLWTTLLTLAGGATVVVGGVLALLQRDLKLTLAYSTISVLGALTLLLGVGTTEAVQAFVVLLIAHAVYKAALFLVAGNVDHHAGHRDPFTIDRLAGRMPVTAAAAVLAGASMAGLPPLVGFAGKEALYVAVLAPPAEVAIAAVAIGGGACLVAAAWIAGFAPFLRGGLGPRRWEDAPAAMLAGPAALAAIGAALALAPGALVDPIAGPAASAITGRAAAFHVTLWHGVGGLYGVALAVGAASVVAGTLAYLAIARRPDAARGLGRRLGAASPDHAFGWLGAALAATAARLTAALQSGRPRRYLATVAAFAIVAVGAPLLVDLATAPPSLDGGLHPYELPLIALVAGGAAATAVARRRLVAVAALGATGLGIAFLFALFSAPDLAITQLMVETLMVIMLVAVFRRLPPTETRDPQARRLGHALVAAAAGTLLALLLLAATATPDLPPTASETFVAAAEARGARNVVNAILVDFRALDTLGEIVVLAIAGVGVSALLRLRPGAREAA